MKVTHDSFKVYSLNELRPSRSSLNRYAIRHGLEDNTKCVTCPNTNKHMVLGVVKTITLDLDHINGDKDDERFSNRRYLCPMCHRATDTYAGKNKGYKSRLGKS
jgi:hypothetical protein